MKRSGMAGVVAIVMVGLVGAAMVALTSQFSGEARRTQHTMAQAQLPNGVADIGPPGNEVHSF